ncbi:hypothetical protein [Lysinibacillus capsici]|uniref:hypothetical protein n=1 Tax=Lysinibacillus capsici TaxID=2115968 RepID=UPI003CFF197A
MVGFWTNIKIKVNTSVKEATTERELALLLSLLDKSTYSGLRDSIAILLLYKTGIRIKTLGALREQNIDFENILFLRRKCVTPKGLDSDRRFLLF